MTIVIFWIVKAFGPPGGYQRFAGTYRLHRQRDYWSTYASHALRFYNRINCYAGERWMLLQLWASQNLSLLCTSPFSFRNLAHSFFYLHTSCFVVPVYLMAASCSGTELTVLS